MQMFLQIVAFSLQNDGSGRPALTKGKLSKTVDSVEGAPFWLLKFRI